MAAKTIALTDTAATTWLVPTDWNPANNKIECIGAGGNGAAGITTRPGGGGGGGAYAIKSNLNLTPGKTVSIQIAAGGSGTDTFLKDSVNATVVDAGAGSNASGVTAGAGGSELQGDSGNSGGNGGSGSSGTRRPGGGGGGAGGPTGSGWSGGAGAASTIQNGGGGGGSNGGSGSNGQAGGSGGNGGNGTGGTGSGAAGTSVAAGVNGTAGTGAGGGAGQSASALPAGGNGSIDQCFDATHGAGGGGGGGGGTTTAAGKGGDGGTYGGGGAGGGGLGATGGAAGAGGQGIIFITYTPIPGFSAALLMDLLALVLVVGWGTMVVWLSLNSQILSTLLRLEGVSALDADMGLRPLAMVDMDFLFFVLVSISVKRLFRGGAPRAWRFIAPAIPKLRLNRLGVLSLRPAI